MINVKKGTAHSLQQTDYRGTNPNPTGYGSGGTIITAGELVYIATTGIVTGCPTSGGASFVGLKGLAINNNYDGDAIESQKIAIYALDGASIIETDQVDSNDGTLNLTTYPVGTPLYPSLNTVGLVSKTNGSSANAWAAPIGWVEGVRFLQNATPYPVGVSGTQNYTSATESAGISAETATANGQPIYNPTTKSATYKAQINIPVLSIKLNVG
jgi:hypothetical protein